MRGSGSFVDVLSACALRAHGAELNFVERNAVAGRDDEHGEAMLDVILRNTTPPDGHGRNGSAPMIENRLMECETKIAYQEETLRVLNEVVTRQQTQIDQLLVACRQLAERIARGANEGAVKGSFADEVPPHY